MTNHFRNLLVFLPGAVALAVTHTGKLSGIASDAAKFSGNKFDYIICGGGLTGLTVASRLSEDPDISVLVIEAGQDNHQDRRVKDVRTYGEAFYSELDHNITSRPVQWQNNSELLLVAGNTLGGSGSINGASWTKGSRSQYNLLPKLTGDESWSWDRFNKFMLQAEQFSPPGADEVADGARYQKDAHGSDGPIQVSFAKGIFESIQQPALEASAQVWENMTRHIDAADGSPAGATVIPNMVLASYEQDRSSPFTAYAQRQVQERSNFHILTGHRVTKILWEEGSDMVAKGVRFQACRACPVHDVFTEKEVLLAAGSLQSPQILELSGVGDPQVLSEAGVPLRKAMFGVGRHLQEQTKSSFRFKPASQNFGGTGPSTTIAFPDAHQVLGKNASRIHHEILSKLPNYASELERKGLVVNSTAAQDLLEAQVNDLFQNKSPAAEVFFIIDPVTGEIGIDTWNLIVLSRGTVHIRSNSTWEHPIVDPSYFHHPYDLQIQTAVAQQSRAVFETSPLDSMIAEELVPGKTVSSLASHAEWEEWVKTSFTSVWHYISTLAMMKESYGGVVDSRLKIYGIENVRVIDASVLPVQLSAHLSSSLYGIAEKAAAIIKENHYR